jgi:peptidoglycan/LPS O-acetylase OafA/YrhL
MAEDSGEKLAYIDAVRGYAILMVMAVHTSQVVSGLSAITGRLAEYGQMGVQLFFVASALTLCLSSAKRNPQITDFYLRRFFRIAPLYYFGIIIYFLIFILRQFTGERGSGFGSYTPINIAANLLFVNNYYPPANNTIVPGGWSISMEMSFYLMFPFLFNWVFRKKRPARLLAILIAGTAVIGPCLLIMIAHNTDISFKNNGFLYFSPLNQVPTFLIGMFLYTHVKSPSTRASLSMRVAAFFALTTISLVIWQSEFEYVFTIIPTIAGLSFSFLVTIIRDLNILRTRVVKSIGRMSYSMYLFHFIFAWHVGGWLSRNTLKEFNPDLRLAILFLFVTTATNLTARVSERAIEANGIRLGNFIIQKRSQRQLEEKLLVSPSLDTAPQRQRR